MSSFSFSNCVLKRLVLQIHKIQDLFGKALSDFDPDTDLTLFVILLPRYKTRYTQGRECVCISQTISLHPLQCAQSVWTQSVNSGQNVSALTYYVKIRTFENLIGKGENAGNQHFLLFP